MFDIELDLTDDPGSLAAVGEALEQAGVSIEGGGMFVAARRGVAHFLVENGDAAGQALVTDGITVRDCRPVVMLRLNQDEPGQLGKVCRAMADQGVNIDVQYSDHAGQLVLVVDDHDRGLQVASQWMAARLG
ncbi:hypothetical protein [Haloechinothrix halophila]|uniref:hypothetical protein n=1 Tax=Haloechinothrix halophila TaxID=1069073 RepID=UPI000405C916|nr:hypothetical protein [Haloechinothrix halophila]